jgi:hypothetical protein
MYEGKHEVWLTFLSLAYFTSMMLSSSIHFPMNGMILFLFNTSLLYTHIFLAVHLMTGSEADSITWLLSIVLQ